MIRRDVAPAKAVGAFSRRPLERRPLDVLCVRDCPAQPLDELLRVGLAHERLLGGYAGLNPVSDARSVSNPQARHRWPIFGMRRGGRSTLTAMGISPYLCRLREFVGHDLLVLPSVAVLPWDADGRLLLVREAQSGLWQTIGGRLNRTSHLWMRPCARQPRRPASS